uniref:TTF-type domain-containing protein n=1 Tax=Aegilops tauschii subsp. strangulata TaxID=200361 RepID=A0A453QM07_AEGTS
MVSFLKTQKEVFCFCCKLFNSDKCKIALGHYEFCDWRHISERLIKHEASVDHITNIKSWNELKIRLTKHETIDEEVLQQQITKMKE